MKRIIYPILSLFCLCATLMAANCILIPKHTGKSLDGSLIDDYYAELDAQRAHQVIFVGDCEVYESFVPAILWERYGITSYVRGSPGQTVWQSYYLLCEMLESERPKAVVFNVYALKHGEAQSEAYNRLTLDGMRMSNYKMDAVRESITEGESELSYVFPLLRYHGRWSELEGDDFKYAFAPKTVSHNGYLLRVGAVPMTEAQIGDILLDDKLPERSMEYLDKIKSLCDSVGAELILVKSPTNTWKYWWYDEWDAQVESFACERNISYYNFIGDEGVGIDWQTDTYDGGAHLNVYGAEKLTERFGDILSTIHGVEDKRADVATSKIWEEKLEYYYFEKSRAEDEAS